MNGEFLIKTMFFSSEYYFAKKHGICQKLTRTHQPVWGFQARWRAFVRAEKVSR